MSVPPESAVTSRSRGTPHLAPPMDRLRKTPLDEQGGRPLHQPHIEVNIYIRIVAAILRSSLPAAMSPGSCRQSMRGWHANKSSRRPVISLRRVNFCAAKRISEPLRNLLKSFQFNERPTEIWAHLSNVVIRASGLAADRMWINSRSMSANKQTRRSKGRKRTAPDQKAAAPAYDRKRGGRPRKASASDVPDLRTWSAPVEQPPRAPEPKTALQSKLDTLIGLLAEAPPAASAEIASHATAAASSQSAAHDLYKDMLWRIASLEAAMVTLPSRRHGLDDDSPLQLIGPKPFTEGDRHAVENSIATLKTQPPEPTEPPVEALEAAQVLRAIGTRRWNAASSGQADAFVPAGLKSVGSETQIWLAKRICAVADAAIHWINSLKPPF